MVQTLTKSETVSLVIPRAIALYVTPEQFEELARVNRDLRLERSATGELIVNPPTGGETGKRNSKLTAQLQWWCEANPDLGEAFDSSTGFRLPNGATRSPDASWVSRERWEGLSEAQREGFVPLCPDFVVELRSQSDSLSKLQNKMREYLENGTRLGWLLVPSTRRVEISQRDRAVEVLENPTQLSGEDILPGFVLELQRIWGR